MDTPSRPQPDPDRRAEDRDADVPAPRGETQIITSMPRPAERLIAPGSAFEPPISALDPLFRYRLERIHICRVSFALDINVRPTTRVLGGYYKSRRLVRIYTNDRREGRRPLPELFDTFLHEVAHHLEYTESRSFAATGCRRVPGRMHSRLFWCILGELKWRWAELHAQRR